MRTYIDIDDNLMREVLKLTGLKTEQEAVEQGLRALLQLNVQKKIRAFRGKLAWEGDLDEMRRD